MKIIRPAITGVLEPSDRRVTVKAGSGSTESELGSFALDQYGNQIEKVTTETLKNLDIGSMKIKIVNKGALDCTVKTRIEDTVYRSVQRFKDLPWGGAIRRIIQTRDV